MANPDAVEHSWRLFFKGFDYGFNANNGTGSMGPQAVTAPYTPHPATLTSTSCGCWHLSSAIATGATSSQPPTRSSPARTASLRSNSPISA
ncbi:MAG: hypothetical protein IPM82_26975 [Saprospiraceae bacterium]|nr:hypothetical protein [Saprospiraceae bacterium]